MSTATVGNVINLDNYLGKPRNRVARIGVELEGGWAKAPTGITIQPDNSVTVDIPSSTGVRGELPIGPTQVAQLAPLMKKYYPPYVDKTCGMHIHMSFETTFQYSVLADSPDYQATVIEYLTRWAKAKNYPSSHAIWERLSGKNKYCLAKYWPERQMWETKKNYQHGDGSRYTAISYQWQRYRTVECRVLPMFATWEEGLSAVRKLIDVTNAYLLLADKKNVRERKTIKSVGSGTKIILELKKGEIYEEYYE